MNTSSPKRIAIIGCAGSGKTTLAFQLHKKFKLPLYHLDHYYWKPNWQRNEFEAFKQIHDELCQEEEWIIEGSYYRLLLIRIFYADTIIFLDAPRYKCLWYVIKRAVVNFGKEIPGTPRGCTQHLFTRKFLEFLLWIWNFNRRYRTSTLSILKSFKDEKQIYVVKSLSKVKL